MTTPAAKPPPALANSWQLPQGGAGGAGPTFNKTLQGSATTGYDPTEANDYVMTQRPQQLNPLMTPAEQQLGVKKPTQSAEQGDTLGNVVNRFSQTGDIASIISMQNQLLQGHFYKSSYYSKSGDIPQFGTIDGDTLSAYTEAVREAARRKMTVDEVIAAHVASAKGVSAQQKAGTAPKLTNPADVEATAKAQGVSVLGRTIDDQTALQAANDYEQLAQKTTQDDPNNPSLQYYSTSPSAAWMDQELQKLMPQTYMANHMTQGAAAITQLLQSKQSPMGNLLS